VSARRDVARQRLLAWADEEDVPLTVGQVGEIVRLLSAVLGVGVLGSKPTDVGRLTWKPGATHDDARRIAAQLEASFSRPTGGAS
jgi:hypothetical protein